MAKVMGLGLIAIGAIFFVLGTGSIIPLSIIPQTISGNYILCLSPLSGYGSAYTSLCAGKVPGTVLAWNWVGALLTSTQALAVWNLNGQAITATCGLIPVYSSGIPIGTMPFGTNYGTLYSPGSPQEYITGDPGGPTYTDGCGSPITSATTSGTANYQFSSTVTTTVGTTLTLYFTSTATTTQTVTTTNIQGSTTTYTTTYVTTSATTSTAQGSTTTYTITSVSTTTINGVATTTTVTATTTSTIGQTTTVTTTVITQPKPYIGTSNLGLAFVILGLFMVGFGAVMYLKGGRKR